MSHFPPHYLLMVHILITFISLVRFSWVDIKLELCFTSTLSLWRLIAKGFLVSTELDLFVEAVGNKNLTMTIGETFSLRSLERWLVHNQHRGDVEPGPSGNCHGSFDSVCEAENVNSVTISCNIKASAAFPIADMALRYTLYHNLEIILVFFFADNECSCHAIF